jgi:hypothetical protein
MRFKDRPTLAKFEQNPAHQKAIREVLQPLTRKVLIYDVATEY